MLFCFHPRPSPKILLKGPFIERGRTGLCCINCTDVILTSAQEELDIRTLQTKNRKLAEMLDQRQAIEDELREHIEKLERRQATDDASLLIVNRYWSQVRSVLSQAVLFSLWSCLIHSDAVQVMYLLICPFFQFDENIRIILKRYDLEQGLGDLLSERKALVVPEPEPDSDSNQERKDERERGEALCHVVCCLWRVGKMDFIEGSVDVLCPLGK